MVEIRGFCGECEAVLDFLPLSRYSKFHFGLQTKGLESRFKSLERGRCFGNVERQKKLLLDEI